MSRAAPVGQHFLVVLEIVANPSQPRGLALFRSPIVQLVILALAVALAYSNTLDVPFYFDDTGRIRENNLIYDWQGLPALFRYEPLRVLCNLTFALNYRLGRFTPRGYHLVNLLVHFLATAAVFGLARGLLRTPRLAGAGHRARDALPFFAAALFALHPLHTEAVTYVGQRLASMAALFYVASMAAYVQGRIATVRSGRAIGFAACAGLGLLGLFTKENTVTLPLALLLIEIAFFGNGAKKMWAAAGAALAALLVEWVIVALALGQNPVSVAALHSATMETSRISRQAYFAAQMPALWTYLRLFAWPAGLHLDYAYGPMTGFADPRAWLALAGHALMLSLAAFTWRSRPMLAFGVVFYYLAHAVESGMIPIRDLMFEHRAYLPDVGLCLVAGWLAVAEWPRLAIRTRFAIAALPLLVLGVATWQRNQVWRDPVVFWRDNARLAPAKPRVWCNLGMALTESGRPAEAVAALEKANELHQGAVTVDRDDLLCIVDLVFALRALGRDDEALALIQRNIDRPMDSLVRVKFYVDLGAIQFDRHRFDEAEAAFRRALEIDPHSLRAESNLASVLAQQGRLAKAEVLYQRVLQADPADAMTRSNLERLETVLRVSSPSTGR